MRKKHKRAVDSFAEFQRELVTDQENIADELARYPQVLFNVGQAVIEADAAVTAAKENLAIVEGELANTVRRRLDAKKKRYTKDVVYQAVHSEQEYKDALDALRAAELHARRWKNLAAAFQSKSYSLSKLSDIYVAQYSSERGIGMSDQRRGDLRERSMQATRRKKKRRTRVR